MTSRANALSVQVATLRRCGAFQAASVDQRSRAARLSAVKCVSNRCRYLKSSVVIDWLDGSLLEFEHSLVALHLLWVGQLCVVVGADAGTYPFRAAKVARFSPPLRWRLARRPSRTA